MSNRKTNVRAKLPLTSATNRLLLPHVESKIKLCELHGRYLRYKQGKDMLTFFFQPLLPAGPAIRIFWDDSCFRQKKEQD